MLTAEIWPVLDYSRVPYRLYHDAEIYPCEQRLIFQGSTSSFLGLEAEIPTPSDFRATYLSASGDSGATTAVEVTIKACTKLARLMMPTIASPLTTGSRLTW